MYCSVLSAWDSIGPAAGTLKAATRPFNTISAVVVQLRSRSLVMVAAVILIISLTYLFYLTVLHLITKSKYSKHRLRAKIVELKAANEKLRQEVAGLNREQAGPLEYKIDAKESPIKEISEFDPQKAKALVELANRLR
ncbi:MAG: hypothetical protein FVQ84_09905 [Planctomycetes bacterium]|nr:hypothetical protein [Planctomycetota bacterium]